MPNIEWDDTPPGDWWDGSAPLLLRADEEDPPLDDESTVDLDVNPMAARGELYVGLRLDTSDLRDYLGRRHFPYSAVWIPLGRRKAECLIEYLQDALRRLPESGALPAASEKGDDTP